MLPSGAERAPLAKPGTLLTLEASVLPVDSSTAAKTSHDSRTAELASLERGPERGFRLGEIRAGLRSKRSS